MAMYVLRKRARGQNQIQYIRDGIVEDLRVPKHQQRVDAPTFTWGDGTLGSYNTAWALIAHGGPDPEVVDILAVELARSWVSSLPYKTMFIDELRLINLVTAAADAAIDDLKAAVNAARGGRNVQ